MIFNFQMDLLIQVLSQLYLLGRLFGYRFLFFFNPNNFISFQLMELGPSVEQFRFQNRPNPQIKFTQIGQYFYDDIVSEFISVFYVSKHITCIQCFYRTYLIIYFIFYNFIFYNLSKNITCIQCFYITLSQVP